MSIVKLHIDSEIVFGLACQCVIVTFSERAETKLTLLQSFEKVSNAAQKNELQFNKEKVVDFKKMGY